MLLVCRASFEADYIIIDIYYTILSVGPVPPWLDEDGKSVATDANGLWTCCSPHEMWGCLEAAA